MLSYKRHLNKKFIDGSNTTYLYDFYQTKNILWTSSGRGSFDLVLKTLNVRENEIVLIPAFIAHGIILPLKRNNISYLFYKSNSNLSPDQNDILSKIDAYKVKLIVIVHYFGFPQDLTELFDKIKSRNVIIVEDCAQSFLSKYDDGVPLGKKGDIAIFSLPKFVPVPDGSFILINNPSLHPVNIKYLHSVLHTLSIFFHLGYLKIKSKQSNSYSSIINWVLSFLSKGIYFLYYKLICLQRNPSNVSAYTQEFLKKFNFEKFRSVRQENAKRIFNSLSDFEKHLPFNKYNDYCTTGIPLTFKDRDTIIREFKKDSIELLAYIKYWDFIPVSQRDQFKNEVEFLDTHFLIPASENFSATQVSYIIAVAARVLKKDPKIQ